MSLRRIRAHPRASAVLGIGVIFMCVAVFAAANASDDTAKSLRGDGLTASISIAIFSVSFAFLGYQLSPYRHLASRAPFRLLLASACALLLAISPLLGIGSASTTGRFAFASIPLGAFAGLVLILLAQREGSADRLLAAAAPARLAGFQLRFLHEAAVQIRELDELDELVRHGPGGAVPPPMHEIFTPASRPPQRDDPVALCVSLARTARDRGDGYAFALALTRVLDIASAWETCDLPSLPDVEEYQLCRVLTEHAKEGLQRIGSSSTVGESKEFASRFVEACCLHVRSADGRGEVDSHLTAEIASAAGAVCSRLARAGERGSEAELLLTACRQLSELALRGRPEMMEEHRLAAYVSIVDSLAGDGIATSDSELVYRCSETIGWMGCAAVRYGACENGRRSAQALVQIGRSARASDLDCFWDRCSRTPFDHAMEHLGWMISWVPASGEKGLSMTGFLEHAYSRLIGHPVTLEVDQSAAKATITVKADESKAWVEHVNDHGVLVKYDYSDHSELRQHVL
jgi:hypothetical protein